MKKNIKSIAAICVLAVVVLSCVSLWSCSNDSDLSEELVETAAKNGVTVRAIESFSEFDKNFASFLMKGKTRSTSLGEEFNDSTSMYKPSLSQWGDLAYEFRSDDGLVAQMVKNINTKYETVACTYYVKNENVDTEPVVLMMQKTADNDFILYDENDRPMMKVQYDPNNDELFCTPLMEVKELQSVLCGAGMAVLGVEVSAVLAVPTMGSSMLFGVLWSVVSYYACK